jgi:hypothetical protein
LAVDFNRSVVLLDTKDWSPKVECRPPERLDTTWDGCFTPDGTMLVAGRGPHVKAPGGVCIFETATGKLLAAGTCYPRPVVSVSVSPDGKLVATAGFDDCVKVFRMDDLLRAGVTL